MGLRDFLASGLRLIGVGPDAREQRAARAAKKAAEAGAQEMIDAAQAALKSGEYDGRCEASECRMTDDKPYRLRHFCGKRNLRVVA
jgi:hypothetical protein